MRKRTSEIWHVDKKELQSMIDNSSSICEVLLKLGFDKYNGNHRTLKKRIDEDNLSLDKLKKNKKKYGIREKIDLEDILKKGVDYNRNSLKKRLVEEGLFEYKCDVCGIEKWNDEPIVLQLDHINGVNNDNRIENLRFLCPNCHSQTKTFSGRNSSKKYKCRECGEKVNKGSKSGLCHKCYSITLRKVDRPSYDVLIDEVKKHGYVGTGKKYGVTDNAIRKWIKQSSESKVE